MSAQILKRFCVFVMSRRCFFGVFFYSLNLFFFPSSSCCSSSFGVLESTAFSVRGRPRGKYAGRNEGNCCMCVCLMLFPRRVPGFAMEPLCVVEAIFHFDMFSVTFFFLFCLCVCLFVCLFVVCLFFREERPGQVFLHRMGKFCHRAQKPGGERERERGEVFLRHKWAIIGFGWVRTSLGSLVSTCKRRKGWERRASRCLGQATACVAVRLLLNFRYSPAESGIVSAWSCRENAKLGAGGI